jgi:hypothetical protein
MGFALLIAGSAMQLYQTNALAHQPLDALPLSQPLSVGERFDSTSMVVIDPAIVVCRFSIIGSDEHRRAAVNRFFSELEHRINGLTNREIRFVAPDEKEHIGSIRFNDDNGHRWMAPMQLEISRHAGSEKVTMALWFRTAHRLSSLDHPVEQSAMSNEEFRAVWEKVAQVLQMPILDAQSEFPEIADLTME